MKCVYLFFAATIAIVACRPQKRNNDIIWYPVDNEEGIFISLYGERRKTNPVSKVRSHRRARYSGPEVTNNVLLRPFTSPLQIPNFNHEDSSFFNNINERKQKFFQTSFLPRPPQNQQFFIPQQYQNFQRPQFTNNQKPDQNNFQEIINEVFDFNKRPPVQEQRFTTSTSRPFERPTDSEWFIIPDRPNSQNSNSNGGNRPLRPNRPTSSNMPNRPNQSDKLVFPGESSNLISTTTESSMVPAETTTMSACERLCQVTPEFNPVCGTDLVTYTNIGRLKCANMCGKGVRLAHYGNCGRGRSVSPPPLEARRKIWW